MNGRSTYFFLGIIILMILLNIWLMVQLKEARAASSLTQDTQIALQNQAPDYQYLTNLLASSTAQQLALEGFSIPDSVTLTDISGKHVSLSEVIGTNKKLIFRMAETHCEECVLQQWDMLINLANKIGADDIQVWADFANPRDLKFYAQTHKLPFQVYQLTSGRFSLPVEQFHIPYLFVISPKLDTNKLFFPRKETPGLSSEYYSIIAQLFSSTQ